MTLTLDRPERPSTPDELAEAFPTPAHLALKLDPDGWECAPHLAYLNTALVDFLMSPDTEVLIVAMPRRHGKSQLISVWMPTWILGLYPDLDIMVTSHSQANCYEWGREVRNHLETSGVETFDETVASDSSSATRFHMKDARGGFRAVTTGGAMTGGGGDVIVVDDPFPGPDEANNPDYREKIWELYTGKIRPLLKKTRTVPWFAPKIIVVMSRYHADDLAGRLKKGMGGDPVRIVELPAFAEPPERFHEDGTTEQYSADELADWTDPLGRTLGEPLWPTMYDTASLNQTRAAVGSVNWQGNYQQRPVQREGNKFKRHWWNYIDNDHVPWAELALCRAWDVAGTEAAGDWTVGALLGVDKARNTYVIDIARDQLEDGGVRKLMKGTAVADKARFGRRVRILIEQEPGSSGKSVAKDYVRSVLAGFTARAQPSSGSKELRAGPFAAQAEAGNVYIVRSRFTDEGWALPLWAPLFVDECGEFPHGDHDDQVDAASAAYLEIVVGRPATRGRVSTAAGQRMAPGLAGRR